MSQSPKVDAAELRALVSTLETLIAEASRITGELKAAIVTAEQIEARGIVGAPFDHAVAAGGVAPTENRGAGGERTGEVPRAARTPAASPWARKRATAAGRSDAPAAAAAGSAPAPVAANPAAGPAAAHPVLAAAPPAVPAATERVGAVTGPSVAGPLPGSLSCEITGAAGGALYGAAPVDPLLGPPPRMTAEPAGPARETRPAPELFEIDATPSTESRGAAPTASTDAERGVALPESLFAAVAHLATVASPDRERHRGRNTATTVAPPVDPGGAKREAAAPAVEPPLPGHGGQAPGSSPEKAPIAAQYETSRPPTRAPLPVSPSGESPPELSLLVDRSAPAVADLAAQHVSAGPPGAGLAPRPVAPLHLVGDPHQPGTLEEPAAPPTEPDPAPEVLTVLPVALRGRDSEAVRLVRDMARRHGLESRGFETAVLDTDIVREIAAALDDLLGKYTVALYGIEVADQREDTIRRERKKATESNPLEAPQVWITLEQAELTGSVGSTGPDRTRRRFRRSGSADRPVYTAVLRAFAAALDEAGGYRARQEAWRILMAGSLSGGPTLGGGLLEPRRALIEGFADFELRGKRAGEPATTLHSALLKMAQAKPEETSA